MKNEGEGEDPFPQPSPDSLNPMLNKRVKE